MPDNEASLLKDPTRAPWNKGKLIGAKTLQGTSGRSERD